MRLSADPLNTIAYLPALKAAAVALEGAGIESPRREARLLLAHLLRIPARRLPPEGAVVDSAALDAALTRRAAREPLAYIVGVCGFWTIDVAVSPASLIPRADSETLIEAALAVFPERDLVTRVLDLGTGTGCLLLAALSEFRGAYGVGVDLNPAAAALAAGNAAALGLEGRAGFVAADWVAPICGCFDLILCNPPYISGHSIPDLMPEVALHEPMAALDGGLDGLAAYQAVIPELPARLRPGGCAILELGQGQAESVLALARLAGFTDLETRRDLAGIDRALMLHAPCA